MKRKWVGKVSDAKFMAEVPHDARSQADPRALLTTVIMPSESEIRVIALDLEG